MELNCIPIFWVASPNKIYEELFLLYNGAVYNCFKPIEASWRVIERILDVVLEKRNTTPSWTRYPFFFLQPLFYIVHFHVQ